MPKMVEDQGLINPKQTLRFFPEFFFISNERLYSGVASLKALLYD